MTVKNTTHFKTSDFDYVLPPQYIARYPLPQRSDGRLLILNRTNGHIHHQCVKNFIDWLLPYDLIVFNDTKVIPARLFGFKASGGRVECLIERILPAHQAWVHLRVSKPPQRGSRIIFAEDITASVVDCDETGLYLLEFDTSYSLLELLEKHGAIPLPPYLQRNPELVDQTRYQTIFARHPGAVAAPTASLHFDALMMEQFAEKQVEIGWVTLHIGAGTFQPVRTEILTNHAMHKEYLVVSPTLCAQVKACKARGGRVFAVGTTVVRALETAAQSDDILPYAGDTQLFLYPHKDIRFRCVDALFTNFHLPRSTLLMLVCAFGGYEQVMHAYQAAVQQQYRFFSYGDAMLLI